MRLTLTSVALLMLAQNSLAVIDLNIVFWVDPVQKSIYDDIAATLKELKGLHIEALITDYVVVIDNEQKHEEKNLESFCDILNRTAVSLILDYTYFRWEQGLDFVQSNRIPYIRVGRMMKPFLNMFRALDKQKDMVELIILVQNQQDDREAMLEVIMGLPFRALVFNVGDDNPKKDEIAQILLNFRPIPNYYAIFARGSNMNTIFERINKGGAFLRPAEWHFVFLDTRDRLFKYKKEVANANKFIVNPKAICRSLNMRDAYCQSGFTFQRALLLEIFRALLNIRQTNVERLEPLHFSCLNDADEIEPADRPEFNILEDLKLTEFMILDNAKGPNEFDEFFDATTPLTYRLNVSISFYSKEHEAITDLALYENEAIRKINLTLSPAKRYFRIGTVESIPWSYYRRNTHTDEILLDAKGKPMWEGYCIDMISALSQKLNFGYEIVEPKKGKFGRRDPKTKQWDGLMGDLVMGETDLIVAALRMYSEREEYIDYIAPYFETTGISIVMRKPARHTSLFKFMTVLRVEVWMSILGAVVSTAIMLWLLDKYSPYSAKNNREAYPYECRDFTLRESIWFALTSFTPQGGGEVPKSISARILVAAYWLFVVLMLATFTANLAAFLTVERIQSPVQSLEQLARQSRINYTVVEGSGSHQYFINMDFAEKTLYRMWKELSMNASREFHKFRVWDYPIREQYTRILLAINTSMPFQNATEGFRKVDAREEADFAFIHDSAEIKYEITRNCNLTEVGEVFAEQPYAIAVQQGSNLADPLAFAMLELQKDRFFENLRAKYWNRTRTACPLTEDEEGISLNSLGGVFIATLCGLGVALISLAFEVYSFRKELKENPETENIMQVKPLEEPKMTKKSEAGPWYIGKKRPKETTPEMKAKTTPPPSFQSAIFRGGKIAPNVTMVSDFLPRRKNMPTARPKLNAGKNEESLRNPSNLLYYVE